MGAHRASTKRNGIFRHNYGQIPISGDSLVVWSGPVVLPYDTFVSGCGEDTLPAKPYLSWGLWQREKWAGQSGGSLGLSKVYFFQTVQYFLSFFVVSLLFNPGGSGSSLKEGGGKGILQLKKDFCWVRTTDYRGAAAFSFLTSFLFVFPPFLILLRGGSVIRSWKSLYVVFHYCWLWWSMWLG
ncbi:hypothetical protein K457DRAFT_637822 [Linnemannia elongata AG-77]|uniref:Uncharacterized protein n=1 Tax=Linnemannia elongata AG-77 TaxID=1314771 RepID=A0A197JS81_9FUNG|nr:hypothetical protein K457DRAFT_637822 [Linnemannia elongata AG-77]